MLHRYLIVTSDFYSISRSSAKPHKLIIFFTSGYQFSGKQKCKSPEFSKTRAQVLLLCDGVLSHSTPALIMITKNGQKTPHIVKNLDLYKAFCTNNDLGALYSRVKQTLSQLRGKSMILTQTYNMKIICCTSLFSKEKRTNIK